MGARRPAALSRVGARRPAALSRRTITASPRERRMSLFAASAVAERRRSTCRRREAAEIDIRTPDQPCPLADPLPVAQRRRIGPHGWGAAVVDHRRNACAHRSIVVGIGA
ncbi:hypothetical protein FM110_04350 [Brachybacterium nesterenkovii]|uniref:Uncharacterized protein n=1 Tax=Brachybacterium nesterenkovii TaxID=47847 RepID=A0A1X6WWE0_9MICO|nr:hypothetical protein FM110_04350 [Brachybacterium nesterenkovii]